MFNFTKPTLDSVLATFTKMTSDLEVIAVDNQKSQGRNAQAIDAIKTNQESLKIEHERVVSILINVRKFIGE